MVIYRGCIVYLGVQNVRKVRWQLISDRLEIFLSFIKENEEIQFGSNDLSEVVPFLSHLRTTRRNQIAAHLPNFISEVKTHRPKSVVAVVYNK